VYSVGYQTLTHIFLLMAHAAKATLAGDHAAAAEHLQRGVALENSMGYFEPPRMLLPLRPCLAEALQRAGRAGRAVAEADLALAEWPGSFWATRAARNVKMSLHELSQEDSVCWFAYGR
jgi:hypothetical protein